MTIPLLTLMLSVACPRPLPVVRPYPAPTVGELANAMAARQQTVSSMNARVRATSWLGGERARATVMMLVDRPGRLRFEAEVSLQGTVALLATDGRQFSFLDTTHNELRRGPACPANVASLIRIPLGPADIAAILLGDVRLPLEFREPDASVDWDSARAADVLVTRKASGTLRILLQRGGNGTPEKRHDRVVGGAATGTDGRVLWRVAFEDFVDVPLPGGAQAATIPLPQTIRFAEGDTAFDEGVEIKVKERALNEPLSNEAFVLSAPPGATSIEVGCPPTAAGF